MLISNMDESLLRKYNSMLVEKNRVVNLTAHKTEEESWTYNIQDSLLFVDEFAAMTDIKLLDIGSGGGCPAVPLKIANPRLDVTMLDSVNKKVEFLNLVCAELSLSGVRAVHTRIEDFAATHREHFDIVTARAVAALPTLLEYALPFLRIGGLLFAFKGKNFNDEIEASVPALKVLGADIKEIKTAEFEDTERVLVIIKKTKRTEAKYPRGKNLPRTAPLGSGMKMPVG